MCEYVQSVLLKQMIRCFLDDFIYVYYTGRDGGVVETVYFHTQI